MRNDRGRRGGKAGAKNGRGEGRGRANQGDAPGGRANNPSGGENGAGGKAAGTGGARGGRGQPWQRGGGGGGGGGGKRAAGSADVAAGSGTGGPLPAVAKAQRRAGPRANKKAKTSETANVLWSPGKGKEAEGNGPSALDGGSGSGEDLSALAKTFKERYGEEVASDDGRDGMAASGNVLDTPVRKRRLSGGASPTTPVEEAAQSMSPARLAAEVQKARARAREERFGGGGGGKRVAAPRGAPAARIPLDHAASGQKKTGATYVASAPSLPQQAPGGKGSATAAARKATPLAEATGAGATSARTASVSATAVTESGGPASSVTPTAVSPPTTNSRAPVRTSAAPTSTASTAGSAAAAPVIVRADTGEVDTSAANKTGTAASAATAPEAIPMDETPTATSAPAPKRSIPDDGDVVVIEPPAKKASAPSKASPAPPSRPAGVAGGKVHTLRLRLRTQAAAEAKQPAHAAPPETGGAGSDGGVEECKGFNPPNPRLDVGVEECKGFDPPNLPLASKSRQQDTAPAASPIVTTESTPSMAPSCTSTTVAVAAAAAAAAATAATVGGGEAGGRGTVATPATTRLGTTASGLASSNSALSRERSWGPSFGILGAAVETSAETRPVLATVAAPSPDVAGVAPPNPWILSPEAPTFARNQGRPLAPSFSKPALAAGGSSGRGDGGGAGTAAGGREDCAAGRAACEINDAAAVGRPAVPGADASAGSRGGTSGTSARGGPGSPGASSASKAPAGTSPRQASPPTPGATLTVGGVTGGKAAGHGLRAQASGGTTPGSNSDTPLATRQSGAGISPPAAVAAAGAGSVAMGAVAAAASPAAAGAEGGAVAPEEQVVLGVQLSGSAGQLLARLMREREESLDHERKLTQALLDL